MCVVAQRLSITHGKECRRGWVSYEALEAENVREGWCHQASLHFGSRLMDLARAFLMKVPLHF
jgi:hypothetical protein